MSAPRAGWLIGVVAFASFAATLAQAVEPMLRTDQGGLALPPVPDAVLASELTPAVPAVTAAAELIARRAPQIADITLPEPPRAEVTFTVADLMADAMAARLGDGQPALHPRLPKKEREAIAAFYAIGGFKPLWVKEGAWTAAARAVIARLQAAHEDALDPAEYPAPALGATPADLALAEVKLSALAVVYARDARGGRIEPARLSSLITPKLELPAADAVLTHVGSAADAGAALASYNPPHAGYRALKAKLAAVRGASTSSRLESDLVANMERWRWLPTELGARHILVNVPEFKLRLMDNGRAVHQARVIVGKPETPTPLFSDLMDHAIVNPSWTVPPSIFKNEFRSDVAYAASRGYQVVRGKNGAVSIRQPPGERNALGFIKFMFPNQHAVYLHDTPNRSLFGAERRAFSHGCVRLDQPFRFAEAVLGSEWSEGRLKSLIGRGERTIRLTQKLPVHLAYFTTFVDEAGELRQIADLYGVNSKVRTALGFSADAVAVADAARLRVKAQRAERLAQARRIEAQRRRVIRRAQAAMPFPAAAYPAQQDFYSWTR
jgi:murein L,D-transpeptidase YcbB/YkuD